MHRADDVRQGREDRAGEDHDRRRGGQPVAEVSQGRSLHLFAAGYSFLRWWGDRTACSVTSKGDSRVASTSRAARAGRPTITAHRSLEFLHGHPHSPGGPRGGLPSSATSTAAGPSTTPTSASSATRSAKPPPTPASTTPSTS